MPPKSKAKELRQLTLFQSAPSMSSSPEKHADTPRKRKTRSAETKPTRKTEYITSSSSDELSKIQLSPAKPSRESPSAMSSEEEIIVPPTSSLRNRRVRPILIDSSASEGENATSSPSSAAKESDDGRPMKRRRLARKRTKVFDTQSSSEDDNVADEVDEAAIISARLRKRGKMSTFQKNLEKLKRRKLKLAEESTGDESQASAAEASTHVKPLRGSKPTVIYDSDDEEKSSSEESSDFIVQDDNVVRLPAEFSMETHQDLPHQFKKIFQFFCHVAIQSAEDRHDFMDEQLKDTEYFSVPLQVVRRKLAGLKDSLVASSVWRPDFRKSLEEFPHLEIVMLDFGVPACDACHLGGRMSTRLGRLGGSKYDGIGFERLDRDSDDEDLREYHLGRFCARRTRVYHQFLHWEHALFQSILMEVEGLRHNSRKRRFHRIAYVGGKEPPENLQDADGICDWLDSRHIIDTEWRKLNDMIESARHLEVNGKTDHLSD